jgi:hypothetical protein
MHFHRLDDERGQGVLLLRPSRLRFTELKGRIAPIDSLGQVDPRSWLVFIREVFRRLK